ncbi:MAG TPA: HAD-IC family P-type ATPase [Acidimicrobiales bacterium]|nr:HAD-IC family P-type ATPase [Acidimicrobiales bacterium]
MPVTSRDELRGLTAADVEARRERGQGNDEHLPTSRSIAQILRANILTRFNAILGALFAAIVIVGPFQDALFGFVLVLNTAIGVVQEVRTKRTLDRLAVLAAPHVRVRRDGETVEITDDDLVVDDLVELGSGDQIPLDGVTVEGFLEVDESLLTGESEPQPKEAGHELLSGSFISSGSGLYRVTKVGSDSYANRLASEARQFKLASSELRDGINRILQIVQWLIIPVAALLITSQVLSHTNFADAVRSCVAGVGAMIPEGLVLLTSITFAIAVARLARRRVLVRELPAVEGLARIDVLCVDKTGTLTTGGIVAESYELVDGTNPAPLEEVLGALAATEERPNATLAAISKRWPPPPDWSASRAVPFSSARKWSGADFGPRGTWVLGAPEILLSAASDGEVNSLRERVDREASAGHRVVLVATTSEGLGDPAELDQAAGPPSGLRAVAIVRLSDQIREDAAETLAYFRQQGIDLKVISGDHAGTVGAIAAAVGVEGADRPVDVRGVADEELAGLVEERSVFGRVTPRQKRAMVAGLQEAGHTVAMTGDGVNDVLALKDADVGVAMGSGSAATKAVAELVLLDNSFAAMPPVIAEGRRVIANVERVANLFLVKTTYATLLAIVIGITAVAYPLLPRHLTIVSYFSIGTPAFLLSLLPNATPFHPGFVDRVLRFSVPCGVIAGGATLVAYFVAEDVGLKLYEQRTMALIVLVACGIWILSLLCRPFNPAKAGIVAGMCVGFVAVLLAPPLRSFFAIELPPAAQVEEMTIIILAAGFLLEVTYRLLKDKAGLTAHVEPD